MDENTKVLMRHSINSGTLREVQYRFNERNELVQDESYFDYELLKLALERKHVSIIKFLLIRLGCRVKNPNEDNSEPAIHLAMKVENPDIIRKMLRTGASIYDKNPNGETALYAAYIGGYYNAVHAALTFISTFTPKRLDFYDDNLKNLDPANVDNIRHFQIACVTNHSYAVRYFLKYKFDVNSPFILNSAELVGSSPLHHAASNEISSSILVSLLESGDLSIKNSNGKTPLQYVYYSGFCTYSIHHIFHSGNHTKFINSVDENGVSHFLMSCAINYTQFAQVFIDNGVDVNSSISSDCSNYPGYTPLHVAVMHGCENIVELLLKYGANCNEKSTKGTTPLHLACQLNYYYKRLPITQMLLKYNACPAAVDENNCTPLHLAFLNMNHCKEIEILNMLIPEIPRNYEKCHVNFTDDNGLSLFHLVCTRNDVSQVCDFLESGVDINSYVKSKKYDGYTALHFAVLYNNKDVVEMLLRWNAKVNIKTKQLELTPLHIACNFTEEKFHEFNAKRDNLSTLDWDSNHNSQLDIIKFLLLHGADVNARDSSGKTPLFSTCTIDSTYYGINLSDINGRVKEIIEILLMYKANVNACTNDKESMLHIISEHNSLKKSEEFAEYLIAKGANVHAVNNAGYTPLHVAVKSNKNMLVKIFLNHQADVNAKSKNSEKLIPLQMIFKYDKFFPYINTSQDIISLLLENDSHVNIRNKETKTVLQNAIESCNRFVIKELLNYGADVNMEDSFGNSSISPLLQWERVGNMDNEMYASIFQIVFTHVQKLLALGLYVSEKVQKCCTKLLQRYKTMSSVPDALLVPLLKHDNREVNLDNVFDNCLEELYKMKLIKIDNYTSLYDILLKDTHEMSKHTRNSKLIQIFDDPNVNCNFPLYGFLLKLKYRYGLKRSNVLKLAKQSLRYVTKLNLPDLCYDSILSYLSNEDIINLKAAAKNNKRKLSSVNYSNAEPSVKLSKKN